MGNRRKFVSWSSSNGVFRELPLDLEGDGLAGQGLDENLHGGSYLSRDRDV